MKQMPLLRLLTDFDGRIGRVRFWLGTAVVALALLAVQKLAPLLAEPRMAATIVAFTGAFALFPWAALAAKRAADRGGAAVFGILLVCAIVLPDQLKPHLSITWVPSLDTVSLLAWCVALVDLGLMPAARRKEALAADDTDAKAASWTPSTPLPLRLPLPRPSIRSTPSP